MGMTYYRKTVGVPLRESMANAAGKQPVASQKTVAEAGLLTAQERIERLVAREMQADPYLSAARAYTNVVSRRPDLYEAYLSEHPEQTGGK